MCTNLCTLFVLVGDRCGEYELINFLQEKIICEYQALFSGKNIYTHLLFSSPHTYPSLMKFF
jgi:hypothetical protein